MSVRSPTAPPAATGSDREVQTRATAAAALALALSGVLWGMLLASQWRPLVPPGPVTNLLVLVAGGVASLSMLVLVLRASVNRLVNRHAHEKFLFESERRALLVATEDLFRADAESRRLALVAEHTHNAVVISGADGNIEWVNPAFTRLTGYALEEVLGRAPGAVLQGPETDPAMVAQLRAAIDERKKIRVELINYTKDQQKFWIQVDLQPVFGPDGALEKFLAIQTDVTARKAAEAALATSRALLQDIGDNVPVALFAKSGKPDTFGQFTLWNRKSEALFGLTSARALGRTDGDFFPKAQADQFAATDLETFASGKPRLITEETLDSLSLGPRTLRTIKVPMFASDGSPSYLLGVSEDITDRIKIEADLLHAKNAAEAATQTKSAFLAAMSHEIRTPMNGILGLIDLLAESPSRGERKQLLRTIKDSGHALLHIIDDVLTFSKAEASHLTLEEIDVDLEELLESVMSTLAPLASRGKVMLLLDPQTTLPRRVGTDPVRLSQVLFNLLSNAIKFTPPTLGRPGEITLAVAVSTGDHPARLKLTMTVTDNGIGMSQATVSELFQPFVQGDASTTRRFGGTGLGLSIVRSIVHLAGGTVSVESTLGGGSKFTVTWHAGEREHPERTSIPLLAGIRVILCGEGNLEDIVKRQLTAAGCEIATVAAPNLSDASAEAVYVLRGSLLDGLSPHELARFVQRRFVRLVEPWHKPMVEQGVRVSTQPLCRSEVLAAFAVAAGRASPATINRFEDSVLPQPRVPTLAEAEAHGCLVLVAEDNAINREVIERQLTRLGYACVVMPDGESALQAWRERNYGLLLTDCHMPGVDGFALTREIRAAEAGTAARLPILALTANAIAGEAERCIAAGMDDFLTKPMGLELLSLALAKWLPPRLEPHKSFDPRALAAYVGEDIPLQRQLLQSFLPQARGLVDEIVANAGGEAQRARADAHKLKASARVVGADGIAQLCASIEAHTSDGDLSLLDLAKRLQTELLSAEQEIVRLLLQSPLTIRSAETPPTANAE